MSNLQADRAFYADQVKRYDAEIAELQADRDGVYQAGEWDQKTRHIAGMMQSRTNAEQMVAFYDAQIAAVQQQAAE